MRISLVILVLFKHKFVTIYITKKEKTMKKILALSAILALFTGCTELSLPKPQTQEQKVTSSNDEECDFECQVKYQNKVIKERNDYIIKKYGN